MDLSGLDFIALLDRHYQEQVDSYLPSINLVEAPSTRGETIAATVADSLDKSAGLQICHQARMRPTRKHASQIISN